ncbi:MAG: divalent-cation tolerance protein CutA [Candidatus Nezhaarchaeales archaeon]
MAARVRGGYALVMITCPSREEAERIAKRLVEARLAACINIVAGLRSLFWWRGRLEEAEEALMLVKTRMDKLERLASEVKALHSYEVPEIVALPIVGGLEDYLRWLDESLS